MTTTDTTEAALLAGILANPEADLPRLVYCDWLEESAGEVECGTCKGVKRLNYGLADGDCFVCSGTGRVSDGRRERSEFIRVQVELAGMPSPPSDGEVVLGEYVCERCWAVSARSLFPSVPGFCPHCRRDRMRKLRKVDTDSNRRATLRRRERELLEAHWVEWFGIKPLPIGMAPPVFSRGFVSHVTASYKTLFGGECGRCGGCGHEDAYCETTCRLCSGTSTLPGIAADLFRNQPVESVTIAGVEPVELPGRSGALERGWHWAVGSGRNSIPWDLYDLMPDNPFPFHDLALQSLSAASVRLGRQRAGVEVPA